MDILWFLRRRLEFISRLYDTATAQPRETLRKIEAEEEPYVDNRNPDFQDVSEPAFLEEALDAIEAIEVVGHWCLMTVYASLQGFLREYVAEMARTYGHDVEGIRAQLNATKAKNWFERYRLFFQRDLDIDWREGPIKVEDLEQINLTRDDLMHNADVTTTYVYRTAKHAERFPKSLFSDEIWEGLGIGSKIKVGRDELTTALQIVENFCAWLDHIRAGYRQYLSRKKGGPEGAAST